MTRFSLCISKGYTRGKEVIRYSQLERYKAGETLTSFSICNNWRDKKEVNPSKGLVFV